MRARALFAVTVGTLLLDVVTPAGAKPQIAEAHISGPGLPGGDLHISGRDRTSGMWESGIELFGHRWPARSDSIAELGLTADQLGPRYLVAYCFNAGRSEPREIVRQELYPYAKGGPVTYIPPGQRVFGANGMTVTTGWYQTTPGFLQYLVDQGLPETNPVAVVDRRSGPDTQVGANPRLWASIVVAFAALAALSMLAAPRLRRRMARG